MLKRGQKGSQKWSFWGHFGVILDLFLKQAFSEISNKAWFSGHIRKKGQKGVKKGSQNGSKMVEKGVKKGPKVVISAQKYREVP